MSDEGLEPFPVEEKLLLVTGWEVGSVVAMGEQGARPFVHVVLAGRWNKGEGTDLAFVVDHEAALEIGRAMLERGAMGLEAAHKGRGLEDAEEKRIIEAIEFLGRTGVRELDFGYLDEDVPVDQARWYAKAIYRGGVLMVDEKTSPTEALEELARRVQDGATCGVCGRPIQWGGLDNADVCRWSQIKGRWQRACEGPPAPRPR